MRDRLLAAIPALRAVALGLVGDSGHADELVQDTLSCAWTGADALPDGPDLTVRLIAALRDRFRSGRGRHAGTDAGVGDGA